ncbi:DNA polymerase III subunit chi [compost metagenome]
MLQRSPTVLASQVDAGLPHKRVLLNLSDRMPDDFAQFERVIEVVSADDDNDRQLARQRWRDYTAQGYAIERRDLVMKTDD